MKTTNFSSMRWIILAAVLIFAISVAAQENGVPFVKISGVVVDKTTSNEIPQATIKWTNSNIIVFTNEEGKFTIKSNQVTDSSALEITSLGYKKQVIPIKMLNKTENRILLIPSPVNLSQITVFPTDPYALVKAVLANKASNYIDHTVNASAFYRETIKKGWNYASLSEAVLSINKQPLTSGRQDQIQMIQGRKSTDYSKIDTISFNLEGGPYSAVRMDILREPYMLFDEEEINKYEFKMGTILPSDDDINYVVEFKQRENIDEPLFYGKLYIDAQKMVLTKATFSMNLRNRSEATKLFIKQKPLGARVYPTLANYTVNYSEKDGKWFYAHSKGEVNFKVKWDKKLFNSNYLTTIEMAVTNWNLTEEKNIPAANRLKNNVRMNQAVSGFMNPDFWGDYNIIEPELPIEKAIEKIRKNIENLK